MNEENEFDRLTEMFYEAALLPELWHDAVVQLGAIFDVSVAHLLGWDSVAGADRLGIVSPRGQELLADYQHYYGGIDPRLQLTASLAVGEIFSCHRHFSKAFVDHNEFYQDFLIPRAGRYSMGTTLLRDGAIEFQLGMTRAAEFGEFDDDDRAGLTLLLPHLRRALAMTMRLQEERNLAILGAAALESSHLGILSLAASGEVLHANRKAESILRARTHLNVRFGRLAATDTDVDATLRHALQDTVATRRPHNLNLGGAKGAGLSCLTLVAAPEQLPINSSAHRVAVIALVTENAKHRVATAQQLIDLFKLSPAEARLARGLAQGEGLDSYALENGVKRTTVRTQLQSALDKTRCNSQKDLVRLVLGIPAVRY